jgi:hypothetical protein
MNTTCGPGNGGGVVSPYHGLREFQEAWPMESRGRGAPVIGLRPGYGMPNLEDYPRTKRGLEFYVLDLTQYFVVKTLESREWKDAVRSKATSLFREQFESLLDQKIQAVLGQFERGFEDSVGQAAVIEPDFAYLDDEARVQIPQSLNWATAPMEEAMYPDLTELVYDWDAEEAE